MFGGVEAGGTKFVCAVGTGPDDLADIVTIPTAEPGPTLTAVRDYFHAHSGDLEAVGVASFGPLELRKDRPDYGHITATPKPGWSGVDVLEPVRGLGVPIGLDTDVNGAALAEARWGAARGTTSSVYLTIGTGVGGGAVVAGRPLHGMVHPEMGHMAVGRLADDDFPGACPFHGDCLEGLIAGPAIARRYGTRGELLEGATLEAAADLVSHYLVIAVRNVVYTLAPETVVVGGGVGSMPGVITGTGSHLVHQLAGYPGLEEHESADFVVAARLAPHSGVLGALILAERAAAGLG